MPSGAGRRHSGYPNKSRRNLLGARSPPWLAARAAAAIRPLAPHEGRGALAAPQCHRHQTSTCQNMGKLDSIMFFSLVR